MRYAEKEVDHLPDNWIRVIASGAENLIRLEGR
jgi:hypothetical protein